MTASAHTMTRDSLSKELGKATQSLLHMARERATQNIASMCLYLLTDIANIPDGNAPGQRTAINRANAQKTPCSLRQAATQLQAFFNDLYDINLHIHHAQRQTTIIDIRYFRKSALPADFQQTVAANAPMLHCKLPLPTHVAANSEHQRFDINWHLQNDHAPNA